MGNFCCNNRLVFMVREIMMTPMRGLYWVLYLIGSPLLQYWTYPNKWRELTCFEDTRYRIYFVLFGCLRPALNYLSEVGEYLYTPKYRPHKLPDWSVSTVQFTISTVETAVCE